MAKVIKGDKQYALVVNQLELDFIKAVVSIIENTDNRHCKSPDWTVYNAIGSHSTAVWKDFFSEGENRGKYPRFREDREWSE